MNLRVYVFQERRHFQEGAKYKAIEILRLILQCFLLFQQLILHVQQNSSI